MGGSIEGLLDYRPRADRGGDNAAVFTCCSIASSDFISAAVLDSHERCTVTAVKERVDILYYVLLIDCIRVHKIHVVSSYNLY